MTVIFCSLFPRKILLKTNHWKMYQMKFFSTLEKNNFIKNKHITPEKLENVKTSND